ncbi:MAG: hypothetical protein HW387_704 [Parachlamydiales bacterium]|nr:hypothetical protein [Parachlamydiales bacterium]
MRRLLIISFFMLAACASGPSIVTMSAFYDIPVGATKDEVIAKAGDPVSINKKDDGSVEYDYVERLKAGSRLLEERHYIIILKEGVVVSKRVEQNSPIPTQFNSYEMQTTFDSYDMQTTQNTETP